MKAISFGEILFDVIGDNEHLGGAPFNLAAHLSKLGNDAWIVSAVGRDDRGLRIKQAAEILGVKTDYLQENDFPTGYVQVMIDEAGKPTYTIHEGVAYDNINKIDSDDQYDCFCFGTLAQRSQISQTALFSTLEKLQAAHVFYDVNLRQNYYNREIIEKSLNYASIVKLNDEEVAELASLLFEEKLSEQDFCKRLMEKYDLKIVIVTRGSAGCAVYSGEKIIEVSGVKVNVADTVGAGDAFSAAFLHKFFETGDLELSAMFANELGAYVASRAGAIPEYED